MAVSIKHKFVSEVADGGDANRVQPSDWNDEHDVPEMAAGDFIAGTADRVATTDGLWGDAGFRVVTYAGTITLDLEDDGLWYEITLTGSPTIALPSNLRDGQSGIIRFIQGSAGTYQLTLASGVEGGDDGVELAEGVGSETDVTYWTDGTSFYLAVLQTRTA